MKQQEILDYLSSHKDEISTRFHVSTLGIFGSYARNEATDSSDIDILYELEQNTPNIATLKQEFKNYLQQNLHHSIDLCRIKYMKPFVRKIIEKEALYV